MRITVNNKGTKKVYTGGIPYTWGGGDPFTHTLTIGPTRCGKSALVLQQVVYQLLDMKRKGYKLGFSLIEPKGSLAQYVADVAREMGLDDELVHVDPILVPEGKSHRFNVMEGDIDIVAEATVIVLKGLFGKQEQFFAIVQELSARNVTQMLKKICGNKLDIVELVHTLRDEKKMEEAVKQLKKTNPGDDLIDFFDNELLGSNKEKYRQFVMGLRAQLENLISNKNLRYVLTGKSDINLDEHYEKGGILAVGTGLQELGTSGDAFGQFVMMHLQRASFRRKGTEESRIPHYLIVDEASRYVNSEVEVFLSISAEYRVAGIFALQSSSQLKIESGRMTAEAMRTAFLGSCRNRIIFGGLAMEDAKALSEELGKDRVIMRQNTYKNNVLLPNLFPDSYRDTETEIDRFSPTDLRDQIPKFHFIAQMQQDGQPMPPRLIKGEFIPRNWKELREWEKNEFKQKNFSLNKKLKGFFDFNELKNRFKNQHHEEQPVSLEETVIQGRTESEQLDTFNNLEMIANELRVDSNEALNEVTNNVPVQYEAPVQEEVPIEYYYDAPPEPEYYDMYVPHEVPNEHVSYMQQPETETQPVINENASFEDLEKIVDEQEQHPEQQGFASQIFNQQSEQAHTKKKTKSPF